MKPSAVAPTPVRVPSTDRYHGITPRPAPRLRSLGSTEELCRTLAAPKHTVFLDCVVVQAGCAVPTVLCWNLAQSLQTSISYAVQLRLKRLCGAQIRPLTVNAYTETGERGMPALMEDHSMNGQLRQNSLHPPPDDVTSRQTILETYL